MEIIKRKIKKIEITRGDTYVFGFKRKNFNKEDIMTIAEDVIFTVKENTSTEEILIQKSLKNNTITFTKDGYYHVLIKPEDTKNLKYNTYKCDIEIQNFGIKSTIYKNKPFIITEEVTF